MQTTIGQSLDLLIGSPQIQAELFDFTNYTQATYDAIVKWKTAFYSFYLPVACALYLVKSISFEILKFTFFFCFCLFQGES